MTVATLATVAGIWRERILNAVDALTHPDRYLAPPDPGTSLDDLLAVKKVIDPHSAAPGSLLVQFFSRLPLLFHAGAKPPQLDTVLLGQDHAAGFAKGLASDSRKEQLAELVGDLLQAIDKAVLHHLDQGTSCPRLLRSRDFVGLGDNGLRPVHRQGVWLMAGLVDALDAGHPLRSRPQADFLELDGDSGRQPAVVLGRCLPALVGAGGPRPFYTLDGCVKWTKWFRQEQLQRRKADPALNPDQYKAVSEALKRLDDGKLPAQSRGVYQPPAPDPRPWRERTLTALETFQHPHRYFQVPPAGTSLADLLVVRDGLDVREDDPDPPRNASERFSSKVAGDVRQQELTGLLAEVLAALDRAAIVELDKALLWAARQMGEKAS